MDVGVQMIFASAGWEDLSDQQVYADELRLAGQAEELGFDALWPVEHHFFDYAFCPDNTELLAYLAARTSTIRLGTAAVILPVERPAAGGRADLDARHPVGRPGAVRHGPGAVPTRVRTLDRHRDGRGPGPLRRGLPDDRRGLAHRLHGG